MGSEREGSATVEDLTQKTELPFSGRVMNCPLPHKFRAAQMEVFKGTKNLLDHLETYKTFMQLQALSNEIMCRAFPLTLKGSTRA